VKNLQKKTIKQLEKMIKTREQRLEYTNKKYHDYIWAGRTKWSSGAFCRWCDDFKFKCEKIEEEIEELQNEINLWFLVLSNL